MSLTLRALRLACDDRWVGFELRSLCAVAAPGLGGGQVETKA